MSELQPSVTILTGLDEMDRRVAAALRDALSPNTRRAYTADWRHWSSWADAYALVALPAEPVDVARYLVAHAGRLTVGTLTRRLSAISKAHALSGHGDPTDNPAVREVLRGLRRSLGTVKRGAPPLWTSDLERIVDASFGAPTGHSPAAIRDRALLLLAFTSALRRSELAALDIADCEFDPAGLIVHIRRSKTDQTGEGAYVGIPYAGRERLCAVRAIRIWLEQLALLLNLDRADLAGPLFRPLDRRGQLGSLGASRLSAGSRLSEAAVRDIVVRRARAAGLTATHGDRFFTAHSTRSGFATQAAANGATERSIMNQGRWKSLQVARSYIRRGSVFTDNAAGRLGL